MFNVLIKDTKETLQIQDGKIGETIEELFPKQNKHFYNFIKTKITTFQYFNNNQFTITHHTYDPTKAEAIIKKKLSGFVGVPANKHKVMHERNYNQWMLLNSENGKCCIFGNLAALARAINVDYVYLYNGIINNSVFPIGKYRFSRNSESEKSHCLSLLVDVL